MSRPPPPDVRRVRRHPLVQKAEALIHETDARTLREQVELTLIPAPPFEEEARAERMTVLLEDSGLEDVGRDREGNVIAVLPGGGPAPPVVLSAHLDTIFPRDVQVEVRREGDLLRGPGICDDGRGLAALLAVGRAMVSAGIRPVSPVLLVATVGEEGPGDLRGVKHLFAEGGLDPGRTGAFVSLDGAGLDRIVVRSVGAVRLRIRARGPGGHSWMDRGRPNPIDALARLAAELSDLPLPSDPPSSLTVARWGGGRSINAIPEEAWIELDLRSEEGDVLARLRERVLVIAEREFRDQGGEDRRVGRAADESALEWETEIIGERPAGTTDPDHPVVVAASQATRAVGARPTLVGSSTDANLPMSLGVPAIAMGAGGEGGHAHTLREWYRNQRGPEGVVRALLTVTALAGLQEPDSRPVVRPPAGRRGLSR